MTTYNGDGNNTTLQANGVGIFLTLANLTSFTIPSQVFSGGNIEAQAGGTFNLPALTQISTSGVFLESTGSGSVLNISSLTSFVATSGTSTLQQTSSGVIEDASLVTLTNVNLVGDSTGTLTLSSGQTYSTSTTIPRCRPAR